MPRLFSLLIVLALLGGPGCRTYPLVTAPPTPAPQRGADVYLAHYDFYHTSLVVPHPDAGTVEYTYADWNILAIDDRSAWSKVKAILLPSRGTLGRAPVAWDGESDSSLRAALDGCWKLSRYRVDAQRVERLTATLDARLTAAADRHGTTERDGMTFVKAPRAYSLAHNCNHALREWMVDLGFRVPRRVALADFRTPGAVHTFAPGRETGGMRTDFNELVGERPDAPTDAP